MRIVFGICAALVVASALLAGAQIASGPPPPSKPAGMTTEMKGVTPAMKHEAPVGGFLTPLNGKVKLRATELEFQPGAMVGDHLHAGPGIRMLVSGELTLVDESGQEKKVQAGEYFYESGDRSIKAYNRANAPAKLVIFELLPADLQGSAMAPLSKRPQLQAEGQTLQSAVCQAK